MGRPKKQPSPAPVEPEEISQEVPEDEEERFLEPEESIAAAQAEASPGGKAPSKADMVRAAMADGMDSPADGVGWIKAHYGIEMPRPLWSSYVAQQKARERKQAGGESPAPRQPRAVVPAAPAPPQAAPRASGGIIADIADIKRLLATHGKDGLEELIRVLS